MVLMPLLSRLLTLLVILTMPLFLARLTLIPIKYLSICFRVIRISITTIVKRRGCLTVPRLTLMSLIKMMLVMVSVAAISKTFGLLRFLLRLSFLAKSRLLPHLLTLWVCKLLMLIFILTKNVITSCKTTMMLFLHLEVKPLMTLTTVLYLSCALISGHLAMMLMELTKRCFFFQAEDVIRDDLVTGVQTCALPISFSGVEVPCALMWSICSGSMPASAS